VPKPKCFCGCGKDVPRLPLFVRSANNLGRDVSERLAYTRAVLGDQIHHPNFAGWEADGVAHIGILGNAIHHHTPVDASELQRWLGAGREMEKFLIQMGGPSILVWLQMPDEMRESKAYAERLNEIRAVLAKGGEEASAAGDLGPREL
jgi:hypothetical protein